MKKTFILQPYPHPARQNCARYILDEAPTGFVVQISEPTKKRIQEEKYHAMIAEIAAKSTYAGKKWDSDDMKRILIDEFAEEMRSAGTPLHHDGRLIPSENGRRVIQLGIQSRDFHVKEAAQFIEFLNAWSALHGIIIGKSYQ